MIKYLSVIELILLNASKLNKSFGEDVVFSDVSFNISDKDKIGFVGVNGAGKTTLFRALLDTSYADGGEVFINKETRIGYMQQHADLHSDNTVFEEVMSVYTDMLSLEEELEAISKSIENGEGNLEELIARQSRLMARFESRGGYTYKSIARSSLIGLGFDESELGKPFETLSGGQKTRVLLCKILLSDSNLLLLDEPTNHLDISSVEWLENFLINYNGAFMVISHDRYFLDKICNRTFELENNTFTAYDANYSRYLKLKEEYKLAKQRRYDNTAKEIQRLEGIIEQQKRWNREKNIKTAESKQKVIDKLEKTLEVVEKEPGKIHFSFNSAPCTSNDILSVHSLSMAYGIHKLFSNISFEIKKNEHVFLLGDNGCGKTTFFKILTGALSSIDGEFSVGKSVQIGYYDQTQENLSYDKTVLDEVYDAYPKLSLTEIRNALAAFLFTGDDVFKTIDTLSGGERARVSLVKLMLSGANFLFLDEPTNHLDISSREALEEALSSYDGTLFIVSHDRYFINKLAHRVLYMQNSSVTNYQGNYDYFLEKFKPALDIKEVVSATNKDVYLEKKRAESQKRKNAATLEKTEKQIAEIEEKINESNALLLTDEYATDYIKASQLSEEISALQAQLDELYIKWEELSEMM
ncbi:MAG: ABC-F family ATP-binding cassette domain-containing protein [Ruminococcaceae bacterium]|nr:ABC-F family ATP-binding cassette domain-containing protein [Oscillospiraceae bacterium]